MISVLLAKVGYSINHRLTSHRGIGDFEWITRIFKELVLYTKHKLVIVFKQKEIKL